MEVRYALAGGHPRPRGLKMLRRLYYDLWPVAGTRFIYIKRVSAFTYVDAVFWQAQ